jgi:predicted nucleotidyltransferase
MADYLAKDFIETRDGLRFAVVQQGLEHGKVLCFLRYLYQHSRWQKVNTAQANAWLQQHQPQYLHYSNNLEARLHAVAVTQISQHYQPRRRLQQLISQINQQDSVVSDVVALCQLLQSAGLDLNQIGITGSLLLGCHNDTSDIDLVFYQRAAFHQARQWIAQGLAAGQLQALSEADWQAAYARREGSLSLAEYVWHEQRKYNKALINQRKVDISFVNRAIETTGVYHKQGAITLIAQVRDDTQGFDYPAIFQLHHPQIQTVLCFTATYTGQAQTGEWVEIAGQWEVADNGEQRLVVGSSREAQGEYIKVVSGHDSAAD